MHPSQVLDLKSDMYVRAGESQWKNMIEIQIELDTNSVNTNGRYDDTTTQKAQQGAKIVAERLQREIHQTHCYYVAPEMTEVISWAAAKFEDDDFFRLDEVPTAHGFAYFEKPLKMTDVRGKTMNINAVVWFPSRAQRPGTPEYNTVTIVYFNDQVATPDEIAVEIGTFSLGPMGRWGMIGIQGLRDNMGVGPETLSANPEKIAELEEVGDTPHQFTNILRLMHSYWLMLNQTITDISEAEIPRAFSRRARRMEIPDRVTVVALRRYEGTHHGDTSVDWQYRWLVRGHWRWQHVSEHHPLAEPDPEGGHRARVWIRPHVKGPDDRPFHLTDKVYGLIR